MTATYVQLIDGQYVTSDAEAWRAECLARHVLALKTRMERQVWLQDFEKRHGKDDTEALKAKMMELHAK